LYCDETYRSRPNYRYSVTGTYVGSFHSIESYTCGVNETSLLEGYAVRQFVETFHGYGAIFCITAVDSKTILTVPPIQAPIVKARRILANTTHATVTAALVRFCSYSVAFLQRVDAGSNFLDNPGPFMPEDEGVMRRPEPFIFASDDTGVGSADGYGLYTAEGTVILNGGHLHFFHSNIVRSM
jgi:hypothetical protein